MQMSADVLQHKYSPKLFAKFIGKHRRWSLSFNKVSGWRSKPLLKKKNPNVGVFLWFLRNFWKYLFLRKTSGQPPLKILRYPTHHSYQYWKLLLDNSDFNIHNCHIKVNYLENHAIKITFTLRKTSLCIKI